MVCWLRSSTSQRPRCPHTASSGDWPCGAWAQGAARLPQSSCPFHLPRGRALAICHSGLAARRRNWNRLCWSSFCQGPGARPHVLQGEILVVIFLAADGLAPRATVVCEVTALARTAQKSSVKAGVFIAKLFLTRAQGVKGPAVFGTWSARSLEGLPARPRTQWG